MYFLLIYSFDQKRVLVLFFAPISFMAFFWSSFPIKFLFLSCGIYWAKRRGSFFIQLRFSVLWYFKKHWPFSWIPKAIVGGLSCFHLFRKLGTVPKKLGSQLISLFSNFPKNWETFPVFRNRWKQHKLSTLCISFCRMYSDFILGRELFFTPPLKGCFQSKELTF